MRSKLAKFTDFTQSLLPHETEYLLSVQEFQDDIKLGILEQADRNAHQVGPGEPFDEALDKRKYSNLKTWVSQRLSAVDVDEQFEWMSALERKIMTDSIGPEDEKELLRIIRRYDEPAFFFTKLYELVDAYRHFLLIRMRYDDHQRAEDFLHAQRSAYLRAKEVSETMHRATHDIVQQFSDNATESGHWEQWLTETYYDEQLDGHTRYQALVRIIFICFNYRKFDGLLEKFEYLEQLFRQGRYYSRRLLLNYYSNRVMLHTKFGEYDKAEYYGYLSVRGKNHDYIHYVNNLSAILLRQQKNAAALELMKRALPDMKQSASFFNKVGFVAFYIKALNANNLLRNAENYAESFLRAYRKEVLEYRWHIFFSAYLESLLLQRKYGQILRVVAKYGLLELDAHYRNRASYVPDVCWYHAVAEYREGLIGQADLAQRIVSAFEALGQRPHRAEQYAKLLGALKPHLEDAMSRINNTLKDKAIQVGFSA